MSEPWWRGPWRRWSGPASAVAASACTRARTGARRIFILPTTMGLAFGVTLFVTLLGSLNYQNNLGLLLTFLMIAIALVSMHHCWFNLLGLELSAQGGPPVFLGQRAGFRISITETRGSPRGELCLRDGDCASLPAYGQVRLAVSRLPSRRGLLPLTAVTLETRHPLGLFRAWTRVPLAASVLVYPRPAPRAPRPPQAAAPEHASTGNRGQGADDFIGRRRYQPGDPPRHLDWKALARERGLLIKQFGGDQAARVWLDWQRLAGDPETRLSLLTRQVLDMDALHLPYGLRLPGLELPPARGDRHKHRCLEALARFGPAEPADGRVS